MRQRTRRTCLRGRDAEQRSVGEASQLLRAERSAPKRSNASTTCSCARACAAASILTRLHLLLPRCACIASFSSRADLDQIQEDLAKHAADPSKPRKFDQDLPGCGQFYCLACASVDRSQQHFLAAAGVPLVLIFCSLSVRFYSRYFMTGPTLDDHLKSKLHKKR